MLVLWGRSTTAIASAWSVIPEMANVCPVQVCIIYQNSIVLMHHGANAVEEQPTCQCSSNAGNAQASTQITDTLASHEMRLGQDHLCKRCSCRPGASPVGVQILPACTLHMFMGPA